ncbi:NAD(P)/FAD-dependent oxidoreductase [Castellaniella sp.]|uniref:NAD(P)/FAD-dependent oxidoreductase n=1 Tax=Castellaniella sp. TaxID=1955812 RepID=UPI00355F2F40
MMAGGRAPRVVIVGGGIIGSCSAWFLRRLGFGGDITVVEKDPSYALCSTALSAASIRTQFESPLNVRMSLYGARFVSSIRDSFGPAADVGYQENGYLILSGMGSANARLAMVDMQRAEGADVVALAPLEIERRFPWISTQGVALGTYGQAAEGWFDAWSLLSLVRTSACEMDVRYVAREVTGFDSGPSRVQAVRLADGSRIPCDWCIMAAGAQSGALTARLDQPLPVSPRKRTVFSFHAPLKMDHGPMLFDSSGIWMRPEGQGFIGGVQPPAERDGDATGDFEPDYRLLEGTFWPALAQRIPAMEALRLQSAWAGHYEVNTLDHNGIVGPHDTLENLLFATGFSGHGLMHAPAVGRAIAEFIQQGRYVTLDLTPLGYARIRAGKPLSEEIVY